MSRSSLGKDFKCFIQRRQSGCNVARGLKIPRFGHAFIHDLLAPVIEDKTLEAFRERMSRIDLERLLNQRVRRAPVLARRRNGPAPPARSTALCE